MMTGKKSQNQSLWTFVTKSFIKKCPLVVRGLIIPFFSQQRAGTNTPIHLYVNITCVPDENATQIYILSDTNICIFKTELEFAVFEPLWLAGQCASSTSSIQQQQSWNQDLYFEKKHGAGSLKWRATSMNTPAQQNPAKQSICFSDPTATKWG